MSDVRYSVLLRAYRAEGAAGLISKRRGRASNRAKPEALRSKALGIIRERYVGSLSSDALANVIRPAIRRARL